MQQKFSRVFLCSLGLPNHFSLQGVFCESVLRPKFENEPIFKLHLHTEKLVIRAQLSKHQHRASSLWLGAQIGDRELAGGDREQVWHGWTGRPCWRLCPVDLMLSTGRTSSFALQCVWFLALGFWGDTVCGSLVIQARPEHDHGGGGQVFFLLLQS